MIEIYTDGATSGNGYEGAQGGWAFVILENGYLAWKSSGHIDNATNNICELTAAIYAINRLVFMLKTNQLSFSPVTLYSDSAYIINCYKQKWYEKWEKNGWKNSKKEPVANKELWEQLIPHFKDPAIKFEKVPEHRGVQWNELVDAMAVEAKFNA